MTITRPIVIIGSSRIGGETARAATLAFEDRADQVHLRNYEIGFYDYDHGNRDDDFGKVVELIMPRTTIVFATPVYWYSMSAYMKLFFDRLTDLITIEKPKGKALAGKDSWLLVTGSGDNLPDGFEVPFIKTSEYFGMNYRGCFYVSSGSNGFETRLEEFGCKVTDIATGLSGPVR